MICKKSIYRKYIDLVYKKLSDLSFMIYSCHIVTYLYKACSENIYRFQKFVNLCFIKQFSLRQKKSNAGQHISLWFLALDNF